MLGVPGRSRLRRGRRRHAVRGGKVVRGRVRVGRFLRRGYGCDCARIHVMRCVPSGLRLAHGGPAAGEQRDDERDRRRAVWHRSRRRAMVAARGRLQRHARTDGRRRRRRAARVWRRRRASVRLLLRRWHAARQRDDRAWRPRGAGHGRRQWRRRHDRDARRLGGRRRRRRRRRGRVQQQRGLHERQLRGLGESAPRSRESRLPVRDNHFILSADAARRRGRGAGPARARRRPERRLRQLVLSRRELRDCSAGMLHAAHIHERVGWRGWRGRQRRLLGTERDALPSRRRWRAVARWAGRAHVGQRRRRRRRVLWRRRWRARLQLELHIWLLQFGDYLRGRRGRWLIPGQRVSRVDARGYVSPRRRCSRPREWRQRVRRFRRVPILHAPLL